VRSGPQTATAAAGSASGGKLNAGTLAVAEAPAQHLWMFCHLNYSEHRSG
jgi:hypothetical protein